MTDLTLTKTRLQSGVWHGVLSGSNEEPNIAVTHLDHPIDGVTITAGGEKDTWAIDVQIPPDAISDGMQTLLVIDASNGEVLDRIVLMAGEAFGDDLRAEVDLLRAELDMLKRAFRRHCHETT